jgi:hypothetical protein
MFNVKDYLKKFVSLENDSVAIDSVIKSGLRDVCQIENIGFEVKKDVLYIKGNPLIRSIVYTKKEALLLYIKSGYGKSRITDIR